MLQSFFPYFRHILQKDMEDSDNKVKQLEKLFLPQALDRARNAVWNEERGCVVSPQDTAVEELLGIDDDFDLTDNFQVGDEPIVENIQQVEEQNKAASAPNPASLGSVSTMMAEQKPENKRRDSSRTSTCSSAKASNDSFQDSDQLSVLTGLTATPENVDSLI